ncbi:hypothetical protein Q8A73_023243 [Channa argus]|nr:hypothetical protein Q8A73_023243 [Channa argus]
MGLLSEGYVTSPPPPPPPSLLPLRSAGMSLQGSDRARRSVKSISQRVALALGPKDGPQSAHTLRRQQRIT